MTSSPDDLPAAIETAPADGSTLPAPDLDPQDEARYQTEEQRLVGLVAKLAKSRGASIRSLEAKAGVGVSVFSKVMSGKVAPSVRHLLRMCDALGVSWAEALPPCLRGRGRDDREPRASRADRRGAQARRRPPRQAGQKLTAAHGNVLHDSPALRRRVSGTPEEPAAGTTFRQLSPIVEEPQSIPPSRGEPQRSVESLAARRTLCAARKLKTVCAAFDGSSRLPTAHRSLRRIGANTTPRPILRRPAVKDDSRQSFRRPARASAL